MGGMNQSSERPLKSFSRKKVKVQRGKSTNHRVMTND